jgi:DNA ligase (NAD+)
MDPQQRIQQLTQRLHYLNNQYYQHDISEVPDQEFDAMLAELNQPSPSSLPPPSTATPC